MKGINRAIIIGNLGQDPELRYLPSGGAACNFSVATSEKWKDANGKIQEQTEWHRIVAYGKLAEICGQYLKKGSKAFIEGSIHTRKWQDKQGVDRYSTEIKAVTMQMLDSLGGQPQGGAAPQQSQRPQQQGGNSYGGAPNNFAPTDDFDDSIPF